jgi:hypothetical protein
MISDWAFETVCAASFGPVTTELANRADDELAPPATISGAPLSAIRVPHHTIAASAKPGRTNNSRQNIAIARALNFPAGEVLSAAGLFEAECTR